MSTRDQYRTHYNAKKDSARASVYFPDARVLWTQSQARRTRTRLTEIEEDKDELNAKTLAEREQLIALRSSWANAVETEAKPICFVPLGEVPFREITEKKEKEVITMTEYEAELLIFSVHVPQTDDKAKLILEDGMPSPGSALWERGDMEMLCSAEHMPGGWLRQWKDAMAESMAETLVETQLGNQAGG